MKQQMTLIFYRGGGETRHHVKAQAGQTTMEAVAALPEVAEHARLNHQVIFGFSTFDYEFDGPAVQARAMVEQHFAQGGNMQTFTGFQMTRAVGFDCDDLVDGRNPRYGVMADEMAR